MRLPGVKELYYVSAKELPAHLELYGPSSDLLDQVNASLHRIPILSEASIDISQSYQNNVEMEKVTVTFITARRKAIPYESALVAELVSGQILLIGSAEHQPAISSKDTTAGADTRNCCEWSAELTARQAVYPLKAITHWEDEESMGDIIGQWDEITEAEIDEIINNLTI